MLRHYSG